ncbi:MAG: adenylate kinase [Clostridia bacterium]|nr:adenylate kinase [Clostridia bacterium]
MKKIIVIGCPGSGKSTFSRSLHQITDIPLYHLDMLYWNPDKTTAEKSVFRKNLSDIIRKDTWIIDGNYGSTMELRLQACDTVFFLDYPTDVCIAGAQARKGRKRPDMPWIEEENEDDAEFIAFIRNYNTENRPKVLELLAKYNDRKIFVFHNRSEADEYLNNIRQYD